MHTLQLLSPPIFSTFLPFPAKTLLKPCTKPQKFQPQKPKPLLPSQIHCYTSDELPVGDDDEEFFAKFRPREKETEEEARRRNWIERGWAPWEEILTPEGKFARTSLNEGEEVPLQDPESIEAFNMLSPKYREEKRKKMGLTEDEFYAKQFEMKGEIPEPLKTLWAGPLVLRHVPPRDWPPPGCEVDREELEFIRGAHRIHHEIRVDYDKVEEMSQKIRVDCEKVEEMSQKDTDMCLDRYKVFLKQYNEWVDANKDRLEEESYKYDQDYYPGRRKRGKDYKEEMYELPFYYPGQICAGKVTGVHLYQGAFVDIGGVHDGWVPIKRNDWFWIRHHIKVGMEVIVEILAKRDPYRFRFPIEMRFVEPNIDHLIFNRFDFPPIFHRDEDTNPDEVRRDCRRAPIPRKGPGIKVEEEPLLSNHPYVDRLWQIHNAEQMILDDFELNPDKYKNKKLSDLTDDEDFDEEKSVQYAKGTYKKTTLPMLILNTSVKDLDLEAALAERQHHEKLRKEALERGEKYKIYKFRRNVEMDEYDLTHWRRSFEEREALIRDISCRRSLGLPLVEPGRYADPSFFKGEYDPESPLYRYDYWGEPKNSEKSKQERMTEAHNKSIVGKGKVWYEMSYDDAIKLKKKREAQGLTREYVDEEDEERDGDGNDEDEDEDDDEYDDLVYSLLTNPPSLDSTEQPHVNGTESYRLSDEGMFED